MGHFIPFEVSPMRFLAHCLFRKARIVRQPRLNCEPLECRTVPAFTASLRGTAVTFNAGVSGDGLTLSVEEAPGPDHGKLVHDLGGASGLVDQYDLDPNTAGEQSRLVSAITSLTINGSGTGNLTMNDVPAPAS